MNRSSMRPWQAGLLAAALLGSLVLAPSQASAALGGTVDSVGADSTAMRGQLRSTGFVNYDVHQISSGALVVNEYATRAGQVFAVSWHGPVPADLQQILGTYFSRFQTAAVAAHRGQAGIHRVFTLADSDLVIRTAGRMRDFGGVAYLPSLIPSGVSVDELQ